VNLIIFLSKKQAGSRKITSDLGPDPKHTRTPWAASRSVVFFVVSCRKTAAGKITQMQEPERDTNIESLVKNQYEAFINEEVEEKVEHRNVNSEAFCPV